MSKRFFFNRLSLSIFLVLLLVACSPESSQVPVVQLKSPESGTEISLGERVLVQSVARDDKGVVKTELWADGRLYEAQRSGEPGGQPVFDVIQIWEASELGTHVLAVKAYDFEGQISAPVTVTVQIVPPKPTPTPTVAPAVTTTVAVDPSCEPSARFVEDVTVPDDSLFNRRVKFTKTWRLRNDGECTWEPGSKWVFIGGDPLGAQSPVEVPLAEPGRLVAISVDMVAPDVPGTYTSTWRLQRPNGEFFGDQAYVRIIVP